MLPIREVVEIVMPSRGKGTCTKDMPRESAGVAWISTVLVATKTKLPLKPMMILPEIRVAVTAMPLGAKGICTIHIPIALRREVLE